MRAALFVLLVPALAFADDAGTKKTLDGAKAALAADLQKLAPPMAPSSWSPQVTPPFPDGAAWVVYGFATSFSPTISDGVRVGSVYAEARPTAGGYALKRIAAKVADLGIQGVHPMSSNAPSTDDDITAYGWVTAGHQHEMPALVKRVYCTWRSDNGVIAAKLPETGTTFLRSLGCK